MLKLHEFAFANTNSMLTGAGSVQSDGLFNDALVDCLISILKIMGHENKINHGIMATRKQLEALAQGERDLPILDGWRKKHGGQTLLDFLDGKLSIHIESGKLTLQNQS